MHTHSQLRYGFGHPSNDIASTGTRERRVRSFFDGIVSATTSSARITNTEGRANGSSAIDSTNRFCQASCEQK